ncbi:MAG: GNAT family N-acetyltransferase [Gemmatimonadota bacterium]|nr:GNAT family N-acetyltransferase [Gemmatimonadota bacterium]
MNAADGLALRPMLPDDWPRVSAIYAEGLATGNATFETDVPTWESWDEQHLDRCRIVAEVDGEVAGWAALTPVSDRCVYGGVGEISVYVADDARGRGVGTRLLDALVKASEEAGLWTLQAGVFAENTASVRIHEKCGFRVVGTRERLGRLAGRWRDVLLLERRSRTVGA